MTGGERVGRVGEVWVFPVKSMSGSAVPVADVERSGLTGDRTWAVVDESGQTVTARHEPRLRDAVARVVDGELRVDVPGEGEGLDAETAGAALSRWLGRSVRLAERAAGGYADVAPVHLVSTASVADAAHADECDACDVTAPRANLVLELAGGGSERAWIGRSVTLGSAELAVAKLPRHCLGVYADVARPGRVSVGDEVRLG